MAVAVLNSNVVDYGRNLDSLIVVDNFQSKRGGVTLDVTGFSKPSIRGGHVVIKATASGELKPMPLNAGGTAYATLPADHEYYGHTVQSVLTSKAMVGVTRRAVINHKITDNTIGYFDMTPILAALKAKFIGQIDYLADNE